MRGDELGAAGSEFAPEVLQHTHRLTPTMESRLTRLAAFLISAALPDALFPHHMCLTLTRATATGRRTPPPESGSAWPDTS